MASGARQGGSEGMAGLGARGKELQLLGGAGGSYRSSVAREEGGKAMGCVRSVIFDIRSEGD